MSPPICNDCRHYIKQSPGFCRRAAWREAYPRTVISAAERGDLPFRWRCTEERIEGKCGKWANLFWPRRV